jgi:hypothetical protein
MKLTCNITTEVYPELIVLAQEGETLTDISKLLVDQILIRWINYNLKRRHGAYRPNVEMRSFTDVLKVKRLSISSTMIIDPFHF